MRIPYQPTAASHAQLMDYYRSQTGYGSPYYVGSRPQHGAGIGSVFANLFKSAFPLIKRGLAFFGKHAVKTGLEVANDVLTNKQPIRESVSKRVPEGIKRLVEEENLIPQTGSGLRGTRKRRRHSKKKSSGSKKKSKKSKKDELF